MRPRPVGAAAACTAAVLLLLLAPSAAGHAVLVQADPPVNSRVDVAPTQLVLAFSEPVEDRYTRVQVTGPDGARYDADNQISDGATSITVPLEPMPDGVYTVSWRTLSRDTHTVSGQYLLAVNVTFDAAAAPPPSSSYASGVPEDGLAAETAVRGVGFLASALAAGLPLVALAVPAVGTLQARRATALRTAFASGLVAAGATVALLAVIGGRIDAGVVEAARTDSGRWVALRGAAALAAGGAAWVAVRAASRPAWLWTAAGFGAVALFATAMSGHAAAEPTLRGVAIGVDLAHQISVAFWVAGVVTIALYALGRPGGHDLAQAIRRFTPFAAGAVAFVVITGVMLSAMRLVSLGDLFGTVYGRVLVIKLVLLVPVVILGALHRLHGQRALDVAAETPTPDDDELHRRRLRTSLAVEVLIMVGVLVAAGALASVAPPDSLPETPTATGGVDPNDIISVIATFEAEGWRGTVRALPQPLTVGPQNITLTLERLDPGAAEVTGAYVIIRAPEEGPEGEGTLRRMSADGNGGFYLAGFLMTQSGTWHNDLGMQGPGLFHQEHIPVYVQPAS